MANYERKDRFYRLAKQRGLPSRASFKIEEILQRFRLISPGDTVLDLGAAPGGWSVILANRLGPKGRVLAIDLQPFPKTPPPQVKFLQADLADSVAEEWLGQELKNQKCSAVFSDMSPKLTGIAFRDAYQSYELGNLCLKTALRWLKLGGALVLKIFPGEEFHAFLKELRHRFKTVKVFEPESSRKTSREVYVLGMGFLGSDG